MDAPLRIQFPQCSQVSFSPSLKRRTYPTPRAGCGRAVAPVAAGSTESPNRVAGQLASESSRGPQAVGHWVLYLSTPFRISGTGDLIRCGGAPALLKCTQVLYRDTVLECLSRLNPDVHAQPAAQQSSSRAGRKSRSRVAYCDDAAGDDAGGGVHVRGVVELGATTARCPS